MPWHQHTGNAPLAAYALSLLASASATVRAQQQDGPPADELSEAEAQAFEAFQAMSIDGLMNATVRAPALVAQKAKEAPGIVTVITREELRLSGARDLIDVLRLVPGFQFGMDVSGVLGLAVRGQWAHEGKVLLLVDGQEMQDLTFATLQFGNHWPLASIERIEIVRGPGSAIYGGNAELALINIITRSAAEVNGASISTKLGQLQKANGGHYYHRSVNVSAGTEIDDLSFVLHGAVGLGKRSNRRFEDFYGGSYRMTNNNTTTDVFINAAASYRDLQLRLIYDRYDTRQRDLYFAVLPRAVDMGFHSMFAELSYALKLFDGLEIIPKLGAKIQYPWLAKSSDAEDYEVNPVYDEAYAGIYDNKRIERYQGSLTLSYGLLQELRVLGGIAYYYDRGTGLDPLAYFAGDEQVVTYWNAAGFLQGILTTDYGNVTVAARMDQHSQAGRSIVPRASYAKAFDRLHFKLVAARAFRAPCIANIDNFNPVYSEQERIKPETSTVGEVEAGLRLSDSLMVVGNVFAIRLHNPIVYFYVDDDAYDNFDSTGTVGAEIELKYKDTRSYFGFAYSYYQAWDNNVAEYEVPRAGEIKDGIYAVRQHDLLGFPRHKATLTASYRLRESLHIGGAIVAQSKKYGFRAVDEDDNLLIGEFDPTLLADIFFEHRDLLVEGLALGVGVHNLFNQKNVFVQPYYGGYHAPLPGPSREFFLSLSYDLTVAE